MQGKDWVEDMIRFYLVQSDETFVQTNLNQLLQPTGFSELADISADMIFFFLNSTAAFISSDRTGLG